MARVKLVHVSEYSYVRTTKYAELKYQKQGAGNWRLIDASTDSVIGQCYPTEAALLADLDRQYATRFKPSPPTHWLDTVRAQLTAVCDHYEKTAPAVANWANVLYMRINEEPESVKLPELLAVERFIESGQWEHPNYAANRIYKLMAGLGQDTTGLAGF